MAQTSYGTITITDTTDLEWFYGTDLTHTSGTAVANITGAAVGSMYLNTQTSLAYKCTAVAANGDQTWQYIGNMAAGVIDNLEIGGKNLLYDTNAPSDDPQDGCGLRYFSNNSSLGPPYVLNSETNELEANTTDNTAEWIKLSDSPLKDIQYGAKCVCNVAGNTNHLVSFYNAVTGINGTADARVLFEKGQIYTASFWAKSDKVGANIAVTVTTSANTFPVLNSNVFKTIDTANVWKRYSWTFTWTGNNATNQIIYMGFQYNIAETTVYLCGFQLEKGNVATDWTDYSKINSSGNGINLIRNTNMVNLIDNSNLLYIEDLRDGMSNHYVTVRNNLASVAKHGIRNQVESAASPFIQFGKTSESGMLNLKKNQDYTLSFDYECQLFSGTVPAGTRYLGVYVYYLPTGSSAWSIMKASYYAPYWRYENDLGTIKSGRIIFTFNIPDIVNNIYIIIRGDNNTSTYYKAGDYIEVRNLKLEEGNIATSWSPASEDIDNKISNVNTTALQALASANGKNTVYYATEEDGPPIDGTYQDGDTWFKLDSNGNTIEILNWNQDQNDWISTQLGQDTIMTNAIKARHITAGAIDANKISVNNLSAINANMGSITAGSLSKGNNFISLDNGTLEFKNASTFSSASQGIQWDGNNLNIKGSLTVTGGNAATTNDVSEAINNIEIGGRNLLRNTKDYAEATYTSTCTFAKDPEGITVITFPAYTGSVGWKGCTFHPNIPYTLIRNKTVTLSFWYRSDSWTLASGGHDYPLPSFEILETATSNPSGTDRLKYVTIYDTTVPAPTTEWQQFVRTYNITDSFFTAGSGTVTVDKYFTIQFFQHNLSHLQYKKFKLEIGNKATDWSPAPEDVEDNINNLGLSGKNLLTGTNTVTTLTSTGTWANRTWRKAGDGTGTITHIDVTDAPYAILTNGWQFDVTSVKGAAYANSLAIAQNAVNVVAGKTYTMSCYAKGTGKLYMFVGISTFIPSDESGKIASLTNAWKRYSITFTAPSNTAVVNANGTNAFFGANGTNVSLSICGMMLEEGDTATLWSPAPGDLAFEEQRIYYRSSVSTKPNGNGLPTTWVTKNTNKWNSAATNADGWSKKVTPISDGKASGVTKFLYLFTCTQSRSVSGEVTYSEILLDDSTTVIDGGNIITGSVKANQIDVNNLFAQDITATGTIAGAKLIGAKGTFTRGFDVDILFDMTHGNIIDDKSEAEDAWERKYIRMDRDSVVMGFATDDGEGGEMENDFFRSYRDPAHPATTLTLASVYLQLYGMYIQMQGNVSLTGSLDVTEDAAILGNKIALGTNADTATKDIFLENDKRKIALSLNTNGNTGLYHTGTGWILQADMNNNVSIPNGKFSAPKSIVRGNVTITPSAANTPTSKAVTWSAMGGVPTIVVTPYTGVPGTQITGCGFSNPSATGCNIVATRTNTSGFTVHYIAIYN